MPYTILKNLYGQKMAAILTISFKITAEIEITCFASYFTDKVYPLCKACVILFIRCHEMRLHCFFVLFFFTVNSSVNAA